MTVNSLMSRAASALPVIGIVLALANWTAKPAAALAWTAAIAMLAIMVGALTFWRRAARRSAGDTTVLRSLVTVTGAVVVGALVMVIPLATTLASAYGLVDDPDIGRRATGVLTGLFLAAFGNVMPRQLPPLSSMQCSGARIQAFQRFAGWTWVLCGGGSALAWLALSIDSAETVAVVLMVVAMTLTIVQLLRLRSKPRQPAPGLH